MHFFWGSRLTVWEPLPDPLFLLLWKNINFQSQFPNCNNEHSSPPTTILHVPPSSQIAKCLRTATSCSNLASLSPACTGSCPQALTETLSPRWVTAGGSAKASGFCHGARGRIYDVSLLLLLLERFKLFIELVIYVLYHRQYFFHRFLSFLSNYTSNLCEVTFGQITIKVFVKFLVKFSFA